MLFWPTSIGEFTICIHFSLTVKCFCPLSYCLTVWSYLPCLRGWTADILMFKHVRQLSAFCSHLPSEKISWLWEMSISLFKDTSEENPSEGSYLSIVCVFFEKMEINWKPARRHKPVTVDTDKPHTAYLQSRTKILMITMTDGSKKGAAGFLWQPGAETIKTYSISSEFWLFIDHRSVLYMPLMIFICQLCEEPFQWQTQTEGHLDDNYVIQTNKPKRKSPNRHLKKKKEFLHFGVSTIWSPAEERENYRGQ